MELGMNKLKIINPSTYAYMCFLGLLELQAWVLNYNSIYIVDFMSPSPQGTVFLGGGILLISSTLTKLWLLVEGSL